MGSSANWWYCHGTSYSGRCYHVAAAHKDAKFKYHH
jgi:hypothetical protein